MTTNTQPFPGQDRSDFCSHCEQHYACANCTAEKCNDRGDEVYDDYHDDEPGHNEFGELGYWASGESQ